MADKILQVLRLSKVSAMGRAKNNGIEKTKNTTESSRDAKMKYIAKPRAKNKEASRGKIPPTMRMNNRILAANNKFVLFNLFFKIIKKILSEIIPTQLRNYGLIFFNTVISLFFIYKPFSHFI